MSRGPRARAGWVVLLAVALAVPRAVCQEEEDLTAGLKAMRAAFTRAREKIDNLEFASAVRELGTVIDPRRNARGADLSGEERELLCSAYDLRGRSHFNLGNQKAAEADFEALLRLEPGYPIDRQTLSPKVVDLFDRVRGRVAGFLVIHVDPPPARLSVDGDPVEPDEKGRLALLAGRRVLRVESDGYDPQEEVLTIVAGMEVSRTLRLRANRRTLQFVTVPADVTILLDGTPVGTTRGPATPEVEAMARQFGFDPRSAAAPFLAPLVAAGDHRVTFERECFQSQTVSVKVALDPENTPLRLSPVVLREARTDLRVTSTPDGAEVLVGGERKGATPLTVPGLCGGEREVTVTKAEVGVWNDRIRLAPGQVNTLDVRLRPTLLYAGTFRLDEWGRAVWSDEDKALLEEMAKGLKTLNLVRSPEALEAFRSAVIKWMITEPDEVRAGAILPPAILEEAASKARADLVLAGLTLGNDAEKAWTLALYSVLHPSPDVVVLRTDRPEGVRDFLRRLDTAPAESAPWLGMGLVDTLAEPGGPGGGAASGPIVARVLPGSPAAKAGVKAGDRVRAVGSRTVESARDVQQAVSLEMARPAGLKATIVLAVEDAAGQRTARVAPGDSPVVVPLIDATLLYNRALAEFRLRSKAARDEAERGAALLNLGVAFMHFRAYDRAQAEGFSRASLPQGPGISEGTVLYYRGLCALRRGDPAASREAFLAASSAAGSTLESGDGPSAAAAAARMLQALE
ncbi:MAG: PEGA domain-containing protein [Acidobacteria bacterium]|nr:PEGA domain-containing protein [Acidobacteriota bacterium]